MELILTDLVTEEVIYIPVLPQEFKVSYANSFGSWNILRLGEVKYQEGVELSGISWESFFECEEYQSFPYVDSNHYLTPIELHNKLERIKIDGRPVRIMLTDSPINFDCYLDRFEVTFQNKKGRIYYSVSWVQDKEIDVSVENSEELADGLLIYRVHIQNQGWQDWVNMGDLAGTTYQWLQMEALQIKSLLNNVTIQYCSHLRDIGWTNWVENGATSGTVGENRQLEAVRIDLKGLGAEKYDIFYRLHVMDYGWLEWSKNGEVNGTVGEVRRAEAIQIVMAKKGQFFESDTEFFFQQGQYDTMAECQDRASYLSDNDKYYTYKVKEYDTLWDIAGIYFGNGERWNEIYEQNKSVIGDDPQNLRPGIVLSIPK